MERLVRFRGHFLNWYDTSDLRPLDPPYISSVDSGNLAGHLIALSGACTAWSGHPVFLSRLTSGAADSLALAREALAALSDEAREPVQKTGALNHALDSLDAELQQPVPGGEHTARRLARLAEQSRQLTDLAHSAVEGIASDQGIDFLFWMEATQRSL